MGEAPPAGANDGCVGPSSADAGRAAACAGCPNAGACASGALKAGPTAEEVADAVAIAGRMSHVRHKVLVLSGKGGVGKSTTSAQLAWFLASRGYRVGVLDVDICGPSAPKMFGLEGHEVHASGSGWSPCYVHENLGVMSIGFLVGDPNEAVVWRGPRKNGLIKQFLKDTDWGDAGEGVDFLVVDTPPGTSDEHISLAQMLKPCLGPGDGALVVTTPQQVSVIDVRKELSFCRKTGLKVLGVVENMSELCGPLGSSFRLTHPDPRTGARVDVTAEAAQALRSAGLDPALLWAHTQVFSPEGGGGEALAGACGVPFLGRVPMDPTLGAACEQGASVFGDIDDLLDGAPPAAAAASASASAMESIFAGVLASFGEPPSRPAAPMQ